MGYLTKQITIQEASFLGFGELISTSDPKLFAYVGQKMRIVTAGREYRGEAKFEISYQMVLKYYFKRYPAPY